MTTRPLYAPNHIPENPEGFRLITEGFATATTVEQLRLQMLRYASGHDFSRVDLLVAAQRAADAKGWTL